LEDIYVEELTRRFALEERSAKIAAWITTAILDGAGITWAKDLLDTTWPGDLPTRAALLQHSMDFGGAATVVRRLVSDLKYLDPSPFRWDLENTLTAALHSLGGTAPDWLTIAAQVIEGPGQETDDIVAPVILAGSPDNDESVSGFSVRLASIDSTEGDRALAMIPVDAAAPWQVYKVGATFRLDPTGKCLGRCLRRLAEISDEISVRDRFYLPWPLSTCLASSSQADDLRNMADLADRGELGDTASWRQAESRWRHAGITRRDILETATAILPFDSEIGEIGVPIAGSMWSIQAGRSMDFALEAASVLPDLPPSRTRNQLAEWAFAAFTLHAGRQADHDAVTEAALSLLPDLSMSVSLMADGLAELLNSPGITQPQIDVIDELSRTKNLYLGRGIHTRFALERIVSMWEEDRDRWGLLRLGGTLAASTSPIPTPRLGIRATADEVEAKRARVLIDIATQSIDDPVSAAKRIAPLLDGGGFAESVIGTALAYRPDGQTLALLVALSKKEPSLDARAVLSGFQELGRRRLSNLASLQEWRTLKLPAELEPFLGTPTT
jgi:hypothetical protein